MKAIAALTTLMALSACVTPVSRDLAFGPQSATAIVVVASPSAVMATSTEFRRVDLDSNTFGDDLFDISTASMGTSHVIAPGNTNDMMLSMREIKPGDYALVSLTTNTFNGYSSGQSWICTHDATPVYSILPGQIVIISTADLWTTSPPLDRAPPKQNEELARAAFEEARTQFAGISGKSTFLQPSARISWPKYQMSLWEGRNRNCGEPAGFMRTK